jgi:hypothetical protein
MSLPPRRAQLAVGAAALLATVIATYPVLLLGRSYVSPNNAGTPLLYPEPPYVLGSPDAIIEDTRGSDIWATTLQSVPHSHIEREALANGEFPLWNRYNAIGRPLWGQGLAFLFDPLHWLTLLSPDLALGWDLKFVAHRFVFATGIGLASFAATGVWLPSAMVATVAPFAGIYSYRLCHPAVFALTYAPWLLLAWFWLARAVNSPQRIKAGILIVVCSSLVLLSATPKEGAITLVAIHTAGALALALSPGGWRQRANRLATGGIAVAASALITAPHWLIFFDTLAESVTLYDKASVSFAGVHQALGLFVSPLVPGVPPPGLNAPAWIFVIAAILTPLGLFARRELFACFLVAAVLLALSFGVVPASWYMKIAYLARVGHIGDVFVTAALPLILVGSAFGAESLLAVSRRRAALLVGIVAVALLCLVLGIQRTTPTDDEAWRAVLLLLPFAAVLPLCMAFWHRSRQFVPAVALCVGAVLLLPGGLHVETGVQRIDRLLLQPRLRATLDLSSPAVKAVHNSASQPGRAVGLDWLLHAGSQALYELEGLGGCRSTRSQRIPRDGRHGGTVPNGILADYGSVEGSRSTSATARYAQRRLFIRST